MNVNKKNKRKGKITKLMTRSLDQVTCILTTTFKSYWYDNYLKNIIVFDDTKYRDMK